MTTKQEIDQCLSSLGMLSEVCLRDISEEEQALLTNRQRLASVAAEMRKERDKKQKGKAMQLLQDRKVEVEATTKIYKSRKLDVNGNKVGKRRNVAFAPKKPMLNLDKYFDAEEDYYEYSCDSVSNIRTNEDDYYDDDYCFNSAIPTSEEEQLRVALELSKLEVTGSQDIRDIRRTEDIHIGMLVEVVLDGFEDTRQRTIGQVVRVLSKGSWDLEGVCVEMEYGVVGRVTALCDEKFIGTAYTLSIDNSPEREENFLWVADAEPTTNLQSKDWMCPIGCGINLEGWGDAEINAHVDDCLRKRA